MKDIKDGEITFQIRKARRNGKCLGNATLFTKGCGERKVLTLPQEFGSLILGSMSGNQGLRVIILFDRRWIKGVESGLHCLEAKNQFGEFQHEPSFQNKLLQALYRVSQNR